MLPSDEPEPEIEQKEGEDQVPRQEGGDDADEEAGFVAEGRGDGARLRLGLILGGE